MTIADKIGETLIRYSILYGLWVGAEARGLDVVVGVHHFQAFILLMPGQTKRAALHIEEAKSLAISTGHIQTICTTLAQRTLWHSLVYGDRSDAERCLNKLLSIAQEHNLTHRIVAMNKQTGSLT